MSIDKARRFAVNDRIATTRGGCAALTRWQDSAGGMPGEAAMSRMKIAGVEIVTDHPGGLRTPVEQRPLLFRPLKMRGVTARNRIMLGPMSQYLAIEGNLTDW